MYSIEEERRSKPMKKFLVIAIAVVAIACEKKDFDQVKDEQLILSLKDIATVGHEVGIDAKTARIYNCFNFTIDTDHEQGERQISIHYGDVIQPAQCLTALGPAKSSISLSDLTDSNYELVINYLGRTIRGNLEVTETHYKLTLGDQPYIKVDVDEIER